MDTMTMFELGVSSGAVSIGTLLSGYPAKQAVGSISGIAGIADLLCRGGWPQAMGKTTDDAMQIAAAYVDGVCESDVSRTDGVKRDPVKVRSLLASLARNESTLAGSKSIDKDIGTGVSKNSVSRYMDALRRINIIDDIPAWHPALRSPVKLRQGAKRHLADPSLAVALLGANPSRWHLTRRHWGCFSNPSSCMTSRFTPPQMTRWCPITTMPTISRLTQLSTGAMELGLPWR